METIKKEFAVRTERDLAEEREYLYWLCRFPGLGASGIRKIWRMLGGFKQSYYIEGSHLSEMGIFRRSQSEPFDQWKRHLDECRREHESLEKQNIRFVSLLDYQYPERLTRISLPPAGLFVKGKLPDSSAPAVAIVGARNCTNYGKQMAEAFGRELAKAKVAVISGLALGIDGAAHRGALQGGGETFGVLGSGIKVCYPAENYPIYRELEKRGGIISEYGLREAPLPGNFPRRNRIISGLADVILVMEARKRSGSLITAGYGLEQGKDVFALPGRVSDPLSEGCNQLIQDGAGVLTTPEAILEFLEVLPSKMLTVQEKNKKGLAKTQKMLYSCLDLQPKHIEQLAAESGLSVQECFSALLELELDGMVVETAHHYYAKKLI